MLFFIVLEEDSFEIRDLMKPFHRRQWQNLSTDDYFLSLVDSSLSVGINLTAQISYKIRGDEIRRFGNGKKNFET